MTSRAIKSHLENWSANISSTAQATLSASIAPLSIDATKKKARTTKSKTPSKKLEGLLTKSLPKELEIYVVQDVNKIFEGTYDKGDYIVVDKSANSSAGRHGFFGHRVTKGNIEFGDLKLIIEKSLYHISVFSSDVSFVGKIVNGKLRLNPGNKDAFLNKNRSNIVPTQH
ncbi:hypothetical protein A1QO_00785 [Vibrio genomosp. F10 str. ZF-129]|uniref:Uncharacterized protein n=1 Tax=Vibrio genomosp. F10 str. ZF-129 TaxID=1187848 RepID=A0A1E5BGE4_9VIBR|nr:hypothetical protein [Vibrio genomosp. F10]OEE35328.1 hypothetical protein A1QO_00785 [Vibrio genomosp. F10 str. ZF-129]